ncbi:unnamed protein product [Brassica oleracea var. botrytis]
MDPMIAKLYKGVFFSASENDIYCSVVKLMTEYTVGKMPRAFVKKTMSKKREGIFNAQPFITDDASVERREDPITVVFSVASTLNAEEKKRVIEAE